MRRLQNILKMNKNIESELILFWPKKKWKTKAKTKENGKGGGVKKAKEKKRMN